MRGAHRSPDVDLREGGKDAETVVAYMQVRIVWLCVYIWVESVGKRERGCLSVCVGVALLCERWRAWT